MPTLPSLSQLPASNLRWGWLAGLLVFIGSSVISAEREWALLDASTLRGELVQARDEDINVRTSGSNSRTIPMSELSLPDRRFVWDWMKADVITNKACPYARPTFRPYSEPGTTGGGWSFVGSSFNPRTNTMTTYVTPVPKQNVRFLNAWLVLPFYFDSSQLEVRSIRASGNVSKQKIADVEAGQTRALPSFPRDDYVSFAMSIDQIVRVAKNVKPPNGLPSAPDINLVKTRVQELFQSNVIQYWKAQAYPEGRLAEAAMKNFRGRHFWTPTPRVEDGPVTFAGAISNMRNSMYSVGSEGVPLSERLTAWRSVVSDALMFQNNFSQWTKASHMWFYPLQELSLMGDVRRNNSETHLEVIENGKVVGQRSLR